MKTCLLVLFLIMNIYLASAVVGAEEAKPSGDRIGKLVIPLRISGVVFTTATAVIWSKYYVTHRDYMNSVEPDKISKFYDDSNKYYKLRNGFIITTGILWAANLAAFFINPPTEGVDEFTILPTINTEDGVTLSLGIRF